MDLKTDINTLRRKLMRRLPERGLHLIKDRFDESEVCNKILICGT
jgi:hypothetical protein